MRELLTIIGILTAFMLAGMLGFRYCEQWDWLQCLYEAVIIMTTVGLSATSQAELRSSTKLFIIVYLLLGVGIFSYCVSQLGQRIVNLRMRQILERRKMDAKIARLKDHYIVCGLGRMGRTICQYLAQRKQEFVVVDTDPAAMELYCAEAGWLHMLGDATHDDILKKAGIMQAKALASVLPTDADNVYVVLSAHLLNDKLQIIARASDEKAGEKMERAGATRVVSPYSTGAMKIARFMLSPSVEDFLEVTDGEGSQLAFADVVLPTESALHGKPLNETNLRDQGLMVLAIRRKSGERLMPPPANTVLMAGDSLFVFGSAASVANMISLSSVEHLPQNALR